jgi:hypothetical protein
MGSLGKQAGEKMLKLDQRTLDKINRAEEEGIIIGNDLELLQSLRKGYEDRGFFTEAQRVLVRTVEKRYEDYPLWRKCAQRLVDLYDEGMLTPESHTFVLSVIDQLNERHKWTFLQYEQVAHIIKKHDDETTPEQKK